MERDNLIGLIFLGVCGVVAAVLIYSIMTGQRITFDLPPVISIALMVVFGGALIYGFAGRFRRRDDGGSGRQWPDPNTGRRSLWDRLRGR